MWFRNELSSLAEESLYISHYKKSLVERDRIKTKLQNFYLLFNLYVIGCLLYNEVHFRKYSSVIRLFGALVAIVAPYRHSTDADLVSPQTRVNHWYETKLTWHPVSVSVDTLYRLRAWSTFWRNDPYYKADANSWERHIASMTSDSGRLLEQTAHYRSMLPESTANCSSRCELCGLCHEKYTRPYSER